MRSPIRSARISIFTIEAGRWRNLGKTCPLPIYVYSGTGRLWKIERTHARISNCALKREAVARAYRARTRFIHRRTWRRKVHVYRSAAVCHCVLSLRCVPLHPPFTPSLEVGYYRDICIMTARIIVRIKKMLFAQANNVMDTFSQLFT